MPVEPQRGELLDQLRQVSRRRRRIVVLALTIPITGALALALFIPRHYRSTALVVVERGAGVSDDDIDARLSVLTSENLSRSHLKAVLERFDLYREMQGHASGELLIDQMQKDVRVEIDKEERGGRNIAVAIRVTYTARNPRIAAGVANELAAFYEREDLRMRELRARYTRSKLQDQLGDARKRLDEQETRLTDYKKRHLRELPEQVGMHLSALTQLNQQIRANRFEPRPSNVGGPGQSAAEHTESSDVPRDERLDRLVQMETRFTDAHPDVKRLKHEIEMVPFVRQAASVRQRELSEQPLSAATVEAASKARVEGIRRNVAELRQLAADHEQGILNAPFRQQELDALLPDYVAARTRYQSLWEQYEVALLWDPKHDGGRLRVLDPAIPRGEAVAPNSTRLVAVGLALSLALCVGLVTVVERLDTSFHTLDDLRAFTNIPVLASVPRLVTSTQKAREKLKIRRFAVLVLLVVALTFVGVAYLSQGALVAWMGQGRT